MAGILSRVSVKSLFLLCFSSLHVILRAQEPRCDPALIDLFACTIIPPPDQPEGHIALLCFPHPDANFNGLLGQHSSNEI